MGKITCKCGCWHFAIYQSTGKKQCVECNESYSLDMDTEKHNEYIKQLKERNKKIQEQWREDMHEHEL